MADSLTRCPNCRALFDATANLVRKFDIANDEIKPKKVILRLEPDKTSPEDREESWEEIEKRLNERDIIINDPGLVPAVGDHVHFANRYWTVVERDFTYTGSIGGQVIVTVRLRNRFKPPS